MIKLITFLFLFPIFANAQTRNIVPRTNNAGNIGLSTLTWSGVYGTQFYGGGTNLTGVIFTTATGSYPLSITGTIPAASVSAGSLGGSVIASSITLGSMWGAPTLTGTNFTAIPNAALVTPVIPSSATGTYPLSISGNATTATTATTVPQSGVNLSTVTANHVLKAGDTMTGPLTVSTLTVTGSNGEFGVRVSSNVYIVGYSSAAKYYGDGSALTGITGGGGGDVYLASTQTFTGQNTMTGLLALSSTTNTGNSSQLGSATFTSSVTVTGLTGASTITVSGRMGIGGTAPAANKLYVSGSATGADVVFSVVNTAASTYLGGFALMAPSMGGGQGLYYDFGKNTSAHNSGEVYYNHVADGSNSNYVGFGFPGHGNILTYTGNLNVGIGTTAPGSKLHVVGDATISTSLTVSSLTVTGEIKIQSYNITPTSVTVSGNYAIDFSSVSTSEYWLVLNSSTTFTYVNVNPWAEKTFWLEQGVFGSTVTMPSYLNMGTAGTIYVSSGTLRAVDTLTVKCPSSTRCYGKFNRDGYTAP